MGPTLMSVMMNFMRTMLTMPKPWVAWIGLLMAANFIFPVIFISSLEGRVVLATGMASAMIQMGIFQTKGFVRLLGIGHSPWIPLLLWLWTRLNFDASPFAYWIVALMVLNTLSLII
ncbi:MAG: hypothetical protein V3R94_08320, partial [Acidobacteriota bacterium]